MNFKEFMRSRWEIRNTDLFFGCALILITFLLFSLTTNAQSNVYGDSDLQFIDGIRGTEFEEAFTGVEIDITQGKSEPVFIDGENFGYENNGLTIFYDEDTLKYIVTEYDTNLTINNAVEIKTFTDKEIEGKIYYYKTDTQILLAIQHSDTSNLYIDYIVLTIDSDFLISINEIKNLSTTKLTGESGNFGCNYEVVSGNVKFDCIKTSNAFINPDTIHRRERIYYFAHFMSLTLADLTSFSETEKKESITLNYLVSNNLKYITDACRINKRYSLDVRSSTNFATFPFHLILTTNQDNKIYVLGAASINRSNNVLTSDYITVQNNDLTGNCKNLLGDIVIKNIDDDFNFEIVSALIEGKESLTILNSSLYLTGSGTCSDSNNDYVDYLRCEYEKIGKIIMYTADINFDNGVNDILALNKKDAITTALFIDFGANHAATDLISNIFQTSVYDDSSTGNDYCVMGYNANLIPFVESIVETHRYFNLAGITLQNFSFDRYFRQSMITAMCFSENRDGSDIDTSYYMPMDTYFSNLGNYNPYQIKNDSTINNFNAISLQTFLDDNKGNSHTRNNVILTPYGILQIAGEKYDEAKHNVLDISKLEMPISIPSINNNLSTAQETIKKQYIMPVKTLDNPTNQYFYKIMSVIPANFKDDAEIDYIVLTGNKIIFFSDEEIGQVDLSSGVNRPQLTVLDIENLPTTASASGLISIFAEDFDSDLHSIGAYLPLTNLSIEKRCDTTQLRTCTKVFNVTAPAGNNKSYSVQFFVYDNLNQYSYSTVYETITTGAGERTNETPMITIRESDTGTDTDTDTETDTESRTFFLSDVKAEQCFYYLNDNYTLSGKATTLISLFLMFWFSVAVLITLYIVTKNVIISMVTGIVTGIGLFILFTFGNCLPQIWFWISFIVGLIIATLLIFLKIFNRSEM